jgi:hypothetical protein
VALQTFVVAGFIATNEKKMTILFEKVAPVHKRPSTICGFVEYSSEEKPF